MNRKNSFFKLITAMALAIIICLSTAIPVLAQPSQQYPGVIEGTENNPAEAGITKILKMPVGTTTPTTTFTFIIEKLSFNEYEDDEHKDLMPYIGTTTQTPHISTVDIPFSDTDIGTADGGTKSVIIETGNLLNMNWLDIDWPTAGVYTYKVTEDDTTFTNNGAAIPDTMDFSPAEYMVSVWVENGDNGSLYVKYVSATVVTTDIDGEKGDGKVDPTPGNQNSSGKGYSQMIFTNTYLLNNGGTDPDDTVLIVSKTVDGLGANQTNLYFPFVINISNPETVADPMTFKAYIFQGNNVIADITDNEVAGDNVTVTKDNSNNDVITFIAGSPLVLKLKHGQWVSFIDLPVGTIFEVTEDATTDYAPSYGLYAHELNESRGASQNDFITAPLAPAIAYVREDNESYAHFLNMFKTITPTGIGVDDLPYIIIIGLAVVSLVGFGLVMFRRRMRPESNEQ